MSITISNIQRMCMQDGPGIRTTVFLKGCSIHCPWCSNPENLGKKKQYFYREINCIKNDNTCSLNPECIILKNKTDLYKLDCDSDSITCKVQAIGVYGKEYSVGELHQVLTKDQKYWGHQGGVTFSGGEALLSMKELEPLMQLLKNDHVHLAMETSLFAHQELLKLALKYIDFFYVDVKILEQTECRNILGGDVTQYLENIELLISENTKKVIFRIPCSDMFTLTVRNIKLLKEFLLRYRNIPVEIFPLHNLAKSKYESLSKSMWTEENKLEEKLNLFLEWMKSTGIDAKKINI